MALSPIVPGKYLLAASEIDLNRGSDGPALDAAVHSSMSLVAAYWNLPPLDLHRFRC